ncbi:MAG: hypothetical protein ACM3JB_05050 [Acidobacteriaceae bacterium]
MESKPAPGLFSSDLFIPATVAKGVHAEKVRPGDEVRFEVVEPVLAGKGVVIPDGAQLYGHIVDSEPLEDPSPSRLAIQIDRAKWHHKWFPLRAFISGLGIRRELNRQAADSRCAFFADVAAREGASGNGMVRHSPETPEDEDDCRMAWMRRNTIAATDREYTLQEMKLETNQQDGSTALISKKKNIYLPSGLLIMLHNVPETEPPGTPGSESSEK